MRTRILAGAAALAVAAASPAAPTGAATLPEHGYVTSSIIPPTAVAAPRTLGRDLTGDGRSDNQLGMAMSALAGQGLDIATTWGGDVRSGKIVMLQSLRTRSLGTDKQARWQLLYGVPVSHPNFSGNGSFRAGSPHSARVPARIVRHHLSTAPTMLPVRLDLGNGPFVIPMALGRAFATCYAKCANGRINGALRSADVDHILVPQIAQLMQALVDRDCSGGTCVPGSAGETADEIFDSSPHDMVISADEVRDSPLVQAVLAPDVDAFRAGGAPGHDGVKDSLSFGFGFRSVRARIVRG